MESKGLTDYTRVDAVTSILILRPYTALVMTGRLDEALRSPLCSDRRVCKYEMSST